MSKYSFSSRIAFRKLLNDSIIYYNHDCFCKLNKREAENLMRLLTYLYQFKDQQETDKDFKGMMVSEISKNARVCNPSSILWKITPLFVKVRSRKRYMKAGSIRLWRLTDQGIALVEAVKNAENTE